MPDLPDNPAPRWHSIAFKDAIAVELHEAGLPAQRLPASSGRCQTADLLVGDFLLTCRRQQNISLPTTIDAVQLAAREAGRELYAAVLHRRGAASMPSTLADAYVLTDFRVFTSILRTMTADALVQNDLAANSLLR